MCRYLLFLILNFFIVDGVLSQLDPLVVHEMAEQEAIKWQSYLNLSDYRTRLLKKKIYDYEYEKSNVIHNNLHTISGSLQSHLEKYYADISEILTPKELHTYKVIRSLNIDDDQYYVKELAKIYVEDDSFIMEYLEYRNIEILPVMINMRMRLQAKIHRADKKRLKSIRNHIYNYFDKCLVSCVIEPGSSDHNLLSESMLVHINKDLEDPNSNLSELLKMVKKYEEEIHQLFAEYSTFYNHWSKWTSRLKDDKILPSHNRSFDQLNRRNELATLRHIESEAMFLLIDPFDEQRSRHFMNIGLISQL